MGILWQAVCSPKSDMAKALVTCPPKTGRGRRKCGVLREVRHWGECLDGWDQEPIER